MTPFATQPIRAAHFPPLNEGEPTACRDGIELSLHVLQGDVRPLSCTTSTAGSTASRLSPSGRRRSRAQVGMWWLYFKWQWLRDAQLERQPDCRRLLAAVFLVLGLLGGWVH